MDVSTQDFRDIQTLVRSLCGLVLADDKTYLVQTRLESVVESHGFATFSEYLGKLQQLGAVQLRDELVEALTTGETSFNRDAYPFEDLRYRLLPALAETIRRRRETNYPIPLARIWSAGCSTGQEPYSIAMAVLDFVAENPSLGLRPEYFPILATDVSNRSLTLAKEGRYFDRELDRGITIAMRSRHFRQEGKTWEVSGDLRKMVEFRRLNFIDEITNMGPFDLIFCRNVLIYFDAPTRQRLCDQFYRLMTPGGQLVLGSAESLYGLSTQLHPETYGRTVVYRK